MAINLDLYIDQGSDFEAILPPVTAANNNVLNLTGYTVAAQMRTSYMSSSAININASITNATTGTITLSMVKENTAGLLLLYRGTPMRYVYDVVIIDSNNIQTKIFEGIILVNPGVTNQPNTSIYDPYANDDFGGL